MSRSSEFHDATINSEIQKVLINIADIENKISHELRTINNLIKKDGQLHTAMTETNEMLVRVAEHRNINVEDLLNDDENSDELGSNVDVLNPAALQNKILECLKKS